MNAIDLDDPIRQHVRTAFLSVRDDQTVAEVLEQLRGRQLPEQIVYFYAVDAENRLTGVIPTRRMLMSAPSTRVGDIAVKKVMAIPEHATVLDACEFFTAHRFLAFPVVDAERRLVGVVDIGLFTEEMIEASERGAAAEVFQLIGVHLESGRKQSAWAGFRARFPWLLSNILAGVLCAFLSGLYEGVLARLIVLALFIPVVLALGESVSIQSATLTLQALHAGRPSLRSLLVGLRREFVVALLLGLASGAMVGGVAWLWKGEPAVAAVIALAICLSMVTACLLGVLLPTAVRFLGRDPRIASGPIVLAIGDLLTLLAYFNLGAWLLARG